MIACSTGAQCVAIGTRNVECRPQIYMCAICRICSNQTAEFNLNGGLLRGQAKFLWCRLVGSYRLSYMPDIMVLRQRGNQHALTADIYIYTLYIQTIADVSISISIYIFIYIHIYLHTYIHTYIHTWHDMTWHDMTWHDMTWHDMTWHDMTLHYITLHYMTWHDITWHYMTLHDITWHYMTYIHTCIVIFCIVWMLLVFAYTCPA